MTDILQIDKMDSLNNVQSSTIKKYIEYYNSENPSIHILKSRADSLRLNLRQFNTTAYSIEDLISTGNLKLFPTQKRKPILKYKNYSDKASFMELKSLE